MKIKLAFLWIYENFFNGLAKAKVSETEASSCVPAARLVPSMSDADAAADVQDILTICFSQNLKFPSLLHLSVLQHVLIIPITTHSPLGKVLSLSAHGLRGLSHPYKDTSQVTLTPLSGM